MSLNSSPQNFVFNETCFGNFQHFGKAFSVVKINWLVLQQIFDGFAESVLVLHFGGANSRVVETWINSTKQIKIQQPIVHGT